ncbi:MAG: hypothetical protein JO296_18985, partial [Pseudonocardiales bacterium]|nr:hypothetical protein [Pseudonocardiales bacterium]
EYRERGRPPELRKTLITLLERLKPITVDGVVTNFQLAVNRAIRESAVPSPAHNSEITTSETTTVRPRQEVRHE